MKDKSRLAKVIIFVVLLLIGIITCINPIYPNEQYLQHLGTIILLAILLKDLRNQTLTTFAFVFFSLFVLFHIIGARYIYSYVPYHKWISVILDGLSKESVPYLHERNSYDRFVHFVFGILVFPIIYEYLIHREPNNKAISIFYTWTIIQTISMFYEIFEWGLTLVLSAEAANDYNGQQGDLWDAQKDMFLTLIGSTLIALIYLIIKKNCAQQRV
jgi:putative membrane protein